MIAIIDYGMGNLRSVAKAFEIFERKVKITSSLEELKRAEKIIFPGVGAFGKAMENLKSLGLIESLKRKVKDGTPFLGICLGLQLLFGRSEEGNVNGLGIIPGKVKRFPSFSDLKIPHMGWNKVKIKNQKLKIFNGIENNSYFYFVHSYYVEPEDKNIISSTTYYGINFTSSIKYKNIFASQFHPEKSGENGLKLIKNFLNQNG